MYVPKNSTYSLRNPALSGYTFAGSSEDTDEIKVTEEEDEEHFHQFLYSYKFVNLPKDAENTLRELLLQITD